MSAYRIITMGSLILCVLSTSVSAGNESQESSVKLQMEKIRSNNNISCRMADIIEKGSNAVSEITPFLDDADPSMREDAAIILGNIADPRSVRSLINALKDADVNVRRRAIVSLDKIAEHNSFAIDKKHLSALVEYGKGSDENAHLVILIIGKIRGKLGISIIKDLCEQATEQISLGGNMEFVGKRKMDASLKMLAVLGDENALAQVYELLNSSSPQDLAKGIEISEYVGKDMVKALFPLLLDKRDALDISPSKSGDYILRVCDLAADVLRDVYHVEIKTQKRTRYTDADLNMFSNIAASEEK